MPEKTSSDGCVRAGKVVYASGAVLWRPRRKSVEVAVIHRPRYNDWSLPKGKVGPDETEPVAAVREVFEETGHRARLGRRLGTVNYPIHQGVKRVRYWTAQTLGGEFTASAEVDDLLWLPVADAMKRLEYAQDRKILRRFAGHPADTQTVLIIRHGTAGRRARFSGDDIMRPLDKTGRAQAESLARQLLAFGATDLHAADRLRCHQTVEPLARYLGVGICNEPSLTEEAYVHNPKQARHRVLQIAGLHDDAGRVPARGGVRPSDSGLHDDAGRTPVICTQGKVIPDLITWWCERDSVRPDKSRNRKGSTWVLSLSGGRLVSADHMGAVLAAKTRS